MDEILILNFQKQPVNYLEFQFKTGSSLEPSQPGETGSVELLLETTEELISK